MTTLNPSAPPHDDAPELPLAPPRVLARLSVAREFDSLHDDPRFQALERSIGIGG